MGVLFSIISQCIITTAHVDDYNNMLDLFCLLVCFVKMGGLSWIIALMLLLTVSTVSSHSVLRSCFQFALDRTLFFVQFGSKFSFVYSCSGASSCQLSCLE